MAEVSGETIPYPHVLGRGERIHKVLIVTIEMGEGDLRQVIAFSRRREEGTLSCCYHIGRLTGGVFRPEAADCLRQASAEDIDLGLEAVLSGVRSGAKGKFLSHTIYDLSAIATREEQLEFLAGRGLRHLVRAAGE